MAWLLAVLGGLVVLVVAVLAMPVRVTVVADGQRFVVRLRALLGLVDVKLGPRPSSGERKPSHRSGRPRLASLLRSQGVGHALGRYVARLRGALHARELTGVIRIGLDDPADTGALWGALTPVILWLAERHPDLVLEPAFDGESLEGTGRGTLVVVPLEVAWATLRFLLSPPMIRLALRRTS